MIKELILSTCALSTFSAPVVSSVSRSLEPEQEQSGYVVEENGMKITYAYDTNEVNSTSDLVAGRVYHYVRDFSNVNDGNAMLCSGVFISRENYLVQDTLYEGLFACNFSRTNNRVRWGNFTNGTTNLDYFFPSDSLVLDVYVIYNSLSFTDDYVYYSKCEDFSFIPIVSVKKIYPSSVMGYVSEFVDDYLLSGIPLIDSLTNTINGTNVTLRSWLNTSICIVIVCLFITVLIIFVRWIFRLFGGLFRF